MPTFRRLTRRRAVLRLARLLVLTLRPQLEPRP